MGGLLKRTNPGPDPAFGSLDFGNLEYQTVIQGQFKISTEPRTGFATILGSCVAACVYDPVACVGGMNHFLLPGSTDANDGNLKYGINSMELLLNGLLQAGANRKDLRAKVFGGANLIKTRKEIGTSNHEFAVWFLGNESIPVVGSSVGGNLGRKVRFHPGSGSAKQMTLNEVEVPAVVKQPAAAPQVTSGDVDLF